LHVVFGMGDMERGDGGRVPEMARVRPQIFQGTTVQYIYIYIKKY
jgi:hypothetical protein